MVIIPQKINDNDLINKTYGDLTILEVVGRFSNCIKVKCRCNICSRINEYWYKDIKNNIGCYHYMCASRLPKDDIFYKLQNTHGKIKDRYNNPKNYRYKYYGARGITCKFEHFIDFYDYAEPLLEQAMRDIDNNMYKLSIDRIDNNKGYIKGNLRFINQSTQILNSSKILNRVVTFINKKTGEKIVFKAKSNYEIADCFGWTYKLTSIRIAERKYQDWQIIVERCND